MPVGQVTLVPLLALEEDLALLTFEQTDVVNLHGGLGQHRAGDQSEDLLYTCDGTSGS